MKILFLCEPRSGSTMLGVWFYRQGNFDVRWETTGLNSRYYEPNGVQGIVQNSQYEHLILKEMASLDGKEKSWDDYINFCDKVVFLYRENFEDQLISYNYALTNGKWDQFYSKDSVKEASKNNTSLLKSIKQSFNSIKEKYFKDSHLSITYEDLYIRNKIHILKDYLNLPDKLDRKFPEGSRYRYKKDNPWSTDPFYKQFH